MAHNTQKHGDVLICGGGVPGLALAALLGGIGLETIVVDPHPPQPSADIPPDGRTAALMTSSINILRAARLWDACAPHGAALKTLRIIEGDAARADFHADELGHPFFGVNMPNILHRSLLAEQIDGRDNIAFLTPAGLDGFSVDDVGVSATLNDGTTIRARVLVGADGRRSYVREQSGIPFTEEDSGQHAITCLIRHSRPHDNISTEFHRPGGPFTIVPLPDDAHGHRSAIVWVEYAADADQFLKLRRDDFKNALQERTENLVGRIEILTPPQSWPLISLRSRDLVAPRVALMAEAAHVLHPMGAQGLNLSLRDIAALAEEIADAARNGLDIGSYHVLRRYEHRRRADIMTRIAGTQGLNKMVSNNLGFLKNIRAAGLKTIHAVEPLRRFTMREGIFPGYDDSRLSRGETL